MADDGPEDWGSKGVNSSDARTRFDFDANVSARDLADSYLPGFEAGARPDLGAASGLMCSYNSGQCGCVTRAFAVSLTRCLLLLGAVNGVPACAHKDMLTTKLRDEWGFQGYVTSDCGAVECVGPSCNAGTGHCSEVSQPGSAAFFACMNSSGHNFSTSPDQIIADVFRAVSAETVGLGR